MPEQSFNPEKFEILLKKKELSAEQIKFVLKFLVWQQTNWQTETFLDLNLSFFGGQFKNNIVDTVSFFVNISSNNDTGLVTFDHNIYQSSGLPWGFQIGASAMTWTTWQTHYDGTGSLTGDPLFVNGGGSFALATDFQIPTGSPAKDAGVSVGLTSDYFGNPVPSGSAPDIGAMEFQQGVSSLHPYHTLGSGSNMSIK